MARSADACELTASIVIERSIQQCWGFYINNALVPEWAPAVSNIECSQLSIDVDVVRKSHVTVDGKSGHIVEKCIRLDPFKYIEFSVIEETFGFSHMLNSYGFNLSFDVDDEHTLLVMKTQYVPKKIFSSLMNAKRTQQQLLDLMSDALQGFKNYVQSQ